MSHVATPPVEPNGGQAAPEDIVQRVRSTIRDVPDFPKPGIVFKDITPVLADSELFRATIDAMAAPWRASGITHVVGIESRGFILGAPVAQRLGAGFIPVRKPGKLPFRRERVEYELEYGVDALEVHADACGAGARVLIVDDVLATGGTAGAAARLLGQVGAPVAGFAFLIELTFLDGGSRLREVPRTSLLRY